MQSLIRRIVMIFFLVGIVSCGKESSDSARGANGTSQGVASSDSQKTEADWITWVSDPTHRLKDVPRNERTHDVCLAAVKVNALNFYCVPREMAIPDFQLEAVTVNWRVLENIRYEFRTEKLCEAAMQQSLEALGVVTTSFKVLNKEWYERSIEFDPMLIRYIPQEER